MSQHPEHLQLSHHPSFLHIEDRLDLIGQKYRVQRIVRAFVLWLALAVAATVAAAFAAHVLREGMLTRILAGVWGIILLAALTPFVRALLIRPKPVQIARLIESRVEGLHNGLTNSVLLASAGDIQDSEFLGDIFDEIAATTQDKPLNQSVQLRDLKRLAMAMLGIAAPAMFCAVIFHSAFAHGFHQLLAPRQFVQQVGSMEILDVQPGDVTIPPGQPLEITMTARGPESALRAGPPSAKLIFDGSRPAVELAATPIEEGQLRYGYRIEHLDDALRYRLEVGGTQSPWFTAAVKQLTLLSVDITITPPAYTHLAGGSQLTIKAADLDKTPITVPQGSVVDIGATMDVPAHKALLQVGENQPLDMLASQENHRFHQTITVLAECNVSIQPMEGEQILAKLPEDGLTLHCTLDESPKVEIKWPAGESVTLPPMADLTIEAAATDDFGLIGMRLLAGADREAMKQVAESGKDEFAGNPTQKSIKLPLHLTAEQCRHGQSIYVQVEATDNRDLAREMKAAGYPNKDDGGPQTGVSRVVQIKFEDPKLIDQQAQDNADKLRQRLMKLLRDQQALMDQTTAFKPGEVAAMNKINAGQIDLAKEMKGTVEEEQFDATTAIIKRTLQVLIVNAAKDAIDTSAQIIAEPVARQQLPLRTTLLSRQENIVNTLESLLAMLKAAKEPTTQPAGAGHDPMPAKPEIYYKKLDEALKQYMEQQRKILDQTASLAKKPVDNYNDDDKKKLAELAMAQENLDAFMQQAISDFSKNAEQDMSNSTELKELYEIETEVTMAKDALKQKAAEIAVPLEEEGLELAKEQVSNIEKWLPNVPDRQQWTQEDPVAKTDTPMPELPAELEDMVGKLMEQQEDLFQEMEDANANWQDSMDKGIGWDATDGPIADMSAKGVTGNTLPNDNEMQGRSGEGRSGKSQGDFVGDEAHGKGGRNTPTRLDPTPFQKGQINDTSKDPTGGATGGGKLSGEGGQGLEGPVPPKTQAEMQRLAQQQAELRNNAERLNLEYKLGRYDNFKLAESIVIMRRVESDLDANRYENALRTRDQLIGALDTSKTLLDGQMHVQMDTTPAGNSKVQQDIDDIKKDDYPPAWSEALKDYYQKLSQQP